MRLEAREVFAGYGTSDVLHGVSLCLGGGEVVGLIGPNGSGKSTLLRAISRAIPIRRGSILLDSDDAARMNARDLALRIGFVTQTESTLFEFSVREVVLMGRHPHLHRRRESSEDFAAATRAMAATDTLQLADRPVTALSGGEHRRVLIARALAQQTPILLLDEPTAHLDLVHQGEVLRIARRLADEQGVGVIAALHDLNLAAGFCHRLLLLHNGQIATSGTPGEVLTPSTLEPAYGPGLAVHADLSGRSWVVPEEPRNEIESACRVTVHVICGGGTGAAVISALHRRGYRVTSGVLNRLDGDQAACAALGIPHVADPPFSPISRDSRSACAEMIGQADGLIVTDVPFGPGNLANLELSLDAARSGTPTFLLSAVPISERDFTGGRATALWRDLKSAGSIPVADIPALEAALAGTMHGSAMEPPPGPRMGELTPR